MQYAVKQTQVATSANVHWDLLETVLYARVSWIMQIPVRKL